MHTLRKLIFAVAAAGISIPTMIVTQHAYAQTKPIEAGEQKSQDHASKAAHESDIQAVRQLESRVALVLSQQGFDAYAKLFHSDYSNWHFGQQSKDRAAFLSAVRRWYEGGGRAVKVYMQPVSIEIMGDLALSRYRLREDFIDGNSFVGDFASLAKKTKGGWLLYRTNFSTHYNGPTEKAPTLPDT